MNDPLADDREQRAFVRDAPAHLTYSELAEQCRARFGEARAWSADAIRVYWLTARIVRGGVPSPIETDRELRAFVEDRVGRWKISHIAAACRERFGDARAPSRSAIHRHWQRLRARSGPRAATARRARR